MMLTIQDAKLLLKQFDIPSIIQQKILLLLLGFGTPSANIIKEECLKLHNINHYNDDAKTLWRLKIFNNNYKILSYSFVISMARYELCIAATNYFQPSNDETYNCMYKLTFKALTANYLNFMFYNLDKFHYGEYGTPTANIIRKTFAK